MLLEYKADPNLADDTGVAPLHIACLLEHTQIAEMLLDAGADAGKAIENEYTPYRIAMIVANPALKKLLQAQSGNRTGKTRTQFESLSPCLQPPQPAPAKAVGQALEEQPGGTPPPVIPSAPSGMTVTLPAAQPGESAPMPGAARERGDAGGEDTSPRHRKPPRRRTQQLLNRAAGRRQRN